MPVQHFDATDPAAYPELAEEVLNAEKHPRLLDVWNMTVYHDMTSDEIAAVLDVHAVTVRKDRAKAHILMREAITNFLADLSREERERIGAERFGVSVAYGHHVRWAKDKTEQSALRRYFPLKKCA